MKFIVDTINGEDHITAKSLSFDGGSLLLFKDAKQTSIECAYSPQGWIRIREEVDDEV